MKLKPKDSESSIKLLSTELKKIHKQIDSLVTGVKGDSEDNYRTGDVNITPENIGLSSLFLVREQSLASQSLAASSNFTKSATVDTVEGYTPIGVIGYAVANAGNIAVRSVLLEGGTTLYCNGRNMNTTAVTANISWYVLYVKSAFV